MRKSHSGQPRSSVVVRKTLNRLCDSVCYFIENWLYSGVCLTSLRVPFSHSGCLGNRFPAMKVLSSLASAKRRHADCQVVKRRGTLYVICKSNPKFKARQGATRATKLSKKGVK